MRGWGTALKTILTGRAILWLAALLPAAAQAGPVLIVVESSSQSNSVYRETLEHAAAIAVTHNLSWHYERIEVLAGAQATSTALFSEVLKRGQTRDVDVLILSGSENGDLLLADGALGAERIQGLGRSFSKLRFVAMTAPDSAGLVPAWRDAGARAALGFEGADCTPGVFLTRFVRRWGESRPLADAVSDAREAARRTERELKPFLTDSSAVCGVPVWQGSNLDRRGREHPVADPVSRGDASGVVARSFEISSHAPIAQTVLESLGSAFPATSLNLSRVPSVQHFVARLGDSMWGMLRDAFPPGLNDGILNGTEKEAWVDGDALRYFLKGLRQWGGPQGEQILDRIQGARLTRDERGIALAFYFSEAFRVEIANERDTRGGRLYAVSMPKTLRFHVSLVDGVLHASGLNTGVDFIRIHAKIPVLPDRVYLRRFTADLVTGDAVAEAGVLGDTVTVVARAKIFAKRFEGIDVWETIRRNLRIFFWPFWDFSR